MSLLANRNWIVTLTNAAGVPDMGLVWAECSASASRIAFNIANGANNTSGDSWEVTDVALATPSQVKHFDDVLVMEW